MPLTLSHAVLHVRDLDAMIDYYTRALGFNVTDRGPIARNGPEIVFMSQDPGEHHQLAFVSAPRAEGACALNHLAFRVADMAELRAQFDRLTSDGRGSQPRPVCHGNTWSLYFADPEQNGVEIFCDTPWHVRQPQGRPWDMSLDQESLLASTRAAFEAEPEFGPGESYLAARARQLGAG